MLKTHLLQQESGKEGLGKWSRKLVEEAYMSEEPVSKFITKVWPPIVTGDKNSASFWLEVAATCPLSVPGLFDAANSETGIRVVEISSSGMIPKPLSPNLLYALRMAIVPSGTKSRCRMRPTLKDLFFGWVGAETANVNKSARARRDCSKRYMAL